MKMKFILFILLITTLYCSIYYLKKYESTTKIKDYYGLVVLDLQEFEEGDSIYITYHTYEGKHNKYIYYEFSNSYPESEDKTLLDYKYCYSDTYSSTKHNVSNGYGGYRIYYTYDYYYYFEFKKPNDADYLIMGYDLSRSSADYLYVDNTRFNRWTTTLIIVGSIGGAILIGGGIFLIWKYYDSIRCDCLCGLFSCLSCLCCTDCCHKTHSYDISRTNNYENKSDKLLDPIPSTPTSIKEEKTDEKPVPEPEEKPVEIPSSNYNPDEAPEQPYFMQDNQNQNYVPPPQNTYGQNGIYENNNQYQFPPNPPQGDPQNDGGYNSQVYNGGGGIYQ